MWPNRTSQPMGGHLKVVNLRKKSASSTRVNHILITFVGDYHGVLRKSAEIIPIEPDTVSTGEGKLI